MSSDKIKDMVAIAHLGFSSGFPLLLISSTLQIWCADHHWSIQSIGWLSFLGFPYLLKPLWAPYLDGRSKIHYVRGMQLLLSFGLLGMAWATPSHAFVLLGFAACVALGSATQDIAIDAYKIERLDKEDYGYGSTIQVMAYRMAMMVTGGMALVIADHLGWPTVYLLSAMMMLWLCIWTSRMKPIAIHSAHLAWTQTLKKIFQGFRVHKQGWMLLAMLLFYRIGESLVGALLPVYLRSEIGLSLSSIGLLYKGIGLGATLLGGIIAGYGVQKHPLSKLLFVVALFQILAMIPLLTLNTHHGLWWVGSVVVLDQLAAGAGTTTLVVLIMHLCNRSLVASQYAYLSAIASLPRIFAGPVAGWWVHHSHWPALFALAITLSIPTLYWSKRLGDPLSPLLG